MMTNEMNCETLRELIPAYSLGATDPDETRQVEAGLKDCPGLAEELAEFQASLIGLARAVPQVEPPAAVLDGLMQRVSAPRRTNRRSWWLAAAAVLALIFVVNNLYWIDRLNQAEQKNARSLSLPSADNGQATGATATVLWTPNDGRAVLTVSQFPAVEAGRVFQGWVRRGSTVQSIGTFQVNPDGSGVLIFDAALLEGSFDAMGVTIEPEGGSDGPTSPPVVRWSGKA
ncbi:MAG: anti-sigma factor [Anaerolineae bacterium]|nr:anti-sigma factor [Anaerolineae bacterium]